MIKFYVKSTLHSSPPCLNGYIERIMVDNQRTQQTLLNSLPSMSIDPFPQTDIYVVLQIKIYGNEQE